jgi:hypothetical protein
LNKTTNKGTGNDRAIKRFVKDMIDTGHGRALLPEMILEQQELHPGFENYINPAIQELCGLTGNLSSTPTKVNIKSINKVQQSIFLMEMLTPKEIHQRTGFSDLSCMLSFASVICGGDIEIMTTTCSKLTWLEEWILYFEFMYGHSKNRWCDYASEYKLAEDNYRRVVRVKATCD